MPEYKITHKTIYDYADNVTRCYNKALVTPLTDGNQVCLSHNLEISPEPDELYRYRDYFENHVSYFSISNRHKVLLVEAISTVSLEALPNIDFSTSLPWNMVLSHLEATDYDEYVRAFPYTLESGFIKFIDFPSEYLNVFEEGLPVLEVASRLTHLVYNKFTYDPKATEINTPLEQLVKKQRGVCQDFAHFMIALLRLKGVPARYVSGFIETLPPPGQPKLVGADATHAWVSVYSPGHGWVGFDPTNGKTRDESYILTARGRDYFDITPLRGVIYGGGDNKLKVSVDVSRVGD